MILAMSAMVLACGQLGDSDAGGPVGESSSSENNPSTVEEYAQLCLSGRRLTDYDTVYEMVDGAKKAQEKYRSITPPREVKEFHDAVNKARDELIEASKLLRGTSRPSEYMFAGIDPQRISGLYRADEELNSAVFDLDPDVRNTLRRYECIE